MILRPLQPLASDVKSISAWEAVERVQTAEYRECWLITQPSHAALAAEVAAHISSPEFPAADAQFLKVFALHDAGWGIPDAQAIMKSRSVHPQRPESFVAMAIPQFLEAWQKSIETCQAVSPAGGYVVSRHFYRLAMHRVKAAHSESKTHQHKLESFVATEERRQKKLAAKQKLSLEQLERFTDLLQFCDLVSLYLCCGAVENVSFPEYFGFAVRMTKHGDSYKSDPKVMRSGAHFAIAALRYPATKAISSREIQIAID